MNELYSEKRIVVLFDEQGTPTFRSDRETNSFIGITATYELSDEEDIYKSCNELFGLSNTKPLENNRISKTRAEDISSLLIRLPIQITISSIDLSNSDLQKVVTLYEEFGNLMRRQYRNIRERPLAHILHAHILDACIFNSICDCAARIQRNSTFVIFIDNWAIPKNDIEISLKDRSCSLESKINSLYQGINFPFQIRIPSITLLNEDNDRKRFIGAIASVVSRSFLYQENERYSDVPFNTIMNIETNKYLEITDEIIEFLRNLMDKILRNPPVN